MGQMNKLEQGEKEKDIFTNWYMDRNLESAEDAVAFSLWELNRLLDRVISLLGAKQ